MTLDVGACDFFFLLSSSHSGCLAGKRSEAKVVEKLLAVDGEFQVSPINVFSFFFSAYHFPHEVNREPHSLLFC